MSIEVKYALRPCASLGFAGHWHDDPLKGVIRGGLAWCLANPTSIDLYLIGIMGFTLGNKTPKWFPVGGALDASCGVQLTTRMSVNLEDFKISGSLQPWIRLSGAATANLSATLLATEVAAVAYALYDPFSSNKLVLATGIGVGVGVSTPIDIRYFFSRLGIEIKWMGELLLFFETLLDLSSGSNSESNSYLAGIIREGKRWGNLSRLYGNLK